jgi:hypothetical protein
MGGPRRVRSGLAANVTPREGRKEKSSAMVTSAIGAEELAERRRCLWVCPAPGLAVRPFADRERRAKERFFSPSRTCRRV